MVAPTLRLVRDDPAPLPGTSADSAQSAQRLAHFQLLQQEHQAQEERLAELQTEINYLRQEVQVLRRRDEVVHFYLHRLDEELRLAARLQQDFLPKTLPQLGKVRFHSLFRPAGYVSGDLFDIFRLDENHVGFYLADAIGHGVPAALLTMFLRTSLVTKEIKGAQYRILDPGETLARLNASLLCQNFSQTTFATAVYGVVDVTNGELRIARAGHPCPVLIPAALAANAPPETPDIAIADIDCASGALLGVFPDEVFPTSRICLNPGDRLLIHSDGIDAIFGDATTDYGKPWRHELIRLRNADGVTMLSEFSTRLDTHSGSLQPKDDLTLIAVEMFA